MAVPVSCICNTYGRREPLNEAVESFLRQDYEGKKELVILNDRPEVEYIFDHPEVKIINFPERFETLGVKNNYCISKASHDWIILWDDDDIVLPWGIRTQMEVVAQEGISFFGARGYFVLRGYMHKGYRKRREYTTKYQVCSGHHPAHYGFDKDLWVEVIGYPDREPWEDSYFFKKIQDAGFYGPGHALQPEQYYFIYRRNMPWPQMSGKKVRWESNEAGRFEIEPHWNRDYLGETRNIIKEQNV